MRIKTLDMVKYQRNWYLKNINRLRKEHRKYYHKHKDKMKKYTKEKYKMEKDKYKKKRKIYYQENKEKINRKICNWVKKHHNIHNSRCRVHTYKLRDKKCLRCVSKENLDFHHTNYDKDEGFTLCRKCHETEKNLRRFIKLSPEEYGSILLSNDNNILDYV
jgi:hypothetical protein